MIATSLLLRRGEMQDEQARLVRRIAASAGRMARLVDQILDFARSRLAGGMPLRRQTVVLEDLVRAAVGELQLSWGPSRVQLDASTPCVGVWDPDRLEQVVSNLIGNALKHGSPHRPVRISLRDDADSVILSVHNYGPAISPELLSVIFDPFRRASVGDGRIGLGLYIAHEIVAAHGGTIAVESTAQDGTTFTVTLPRAAALDLPAAAS